MSSSIIIWNGSNGSDAVTYPTAWHCSGHTAYRQWYTLIGTKPKEGTMGPACISQKYRHQYVTPQRMNKHCIEHTAKSLSRHATITKRTPKSIMDIGQLHWNAMGSWALKQYGPAYRQQQSITTRPSQQQQQQQQGTTEWMQGFYGLKWGMGEWQTSDRYMGSWGQMKRKQAVINNAAN